MNREYGLLAVNHQRLRSAYDYAEILLPKNDFTVTEAMGNGLHKIYVLGCEEFQRFTGSSQQFKASLVSDLKE